MNEITPQSNNHFERVERFVALRNGEFWKANNTIEDRDITKGEVLMIAGIDDVDGEPHTIRVRLHPSKVTRWNTETKFLVNEFLSIFEFFGEEKAQTVREEEIKAIQDKLKEEQNMLHEACNNMAMMDRLIEEDAPKDNGKTNLPIKHEAVGADVIGAIRTQKVASLMTTGLTANGIEQIKSRMEEQRNIAVRRSDWIAKRTQKLSQIADEMTPFFEEKAAVALALTKNMRDHVDELMKGIGNLNLYVLKNVEIETLKEGCSAAENEKLSITQRVLYMDEELAVYEDVHDQFDCHDREVFFSAIAKYPCLVDQIFPTSRCVVALATTRKQPDYQSRGYHAIEAEALLRENQRQFLLVRDGANIHLVLSPEIWHQFSDTLFPTVNESEAPFRGLDGREITYRDLEYTDALSRHEHIALGYKRMLILLCGLDHNRKLFGNFYPGDPSLDFVSMAFQERYFNFIHDVDGRGMLPRHCPLSVYDWADQMNEEIGAGSRVIVRWSNMFSVESIPSCYERENRWNTMHDNRRTLQYRPSKEDGNGFIEGYLIHHQGHLAMEIPVVGETLDYQKRTFKAKLNMSHAMQYANRFTYLCVDRLNPDEANFYLHHRPSRNLNVSGIRMLKCAISMAEEDRLSEKPIRDALLNTLLEGHIAEDEETAIWLVDIGIAKYKCAHPKKDIMSLLTDSKRFNALCDQLYQLSDKGRDLSGSIKESEERLGRSVIRISLLTNGQYCAYSTPLPNERDDRLYAFNWVVKTRYKPLKNSISAQKPTFVLLRKSANSETVLYDVEDMDSYVVEGEPVFKTPNSKANFLDTIVQENNRLQWEEILSMKGDEEKIIQYIGHFKEYREKLTYSSKNNYVIDPSVRVDIGACARNDALYKIGFECYAFELIAWLIEGNNSLSRDFANIYAGIYSDEYSAKNRLKQTQERIKDLLLYEVMKFRLISPNAESGLLTQETQSYSIDKDEYKRYSLNARIERLRDLGHSIFIDTAIGCDLDAWLNIKMPEGFEPFFYYGDSFGEGSKLDIFVCNEETKSEFGSYLNVIDSWKKIEERFKQTQHMNQTGKECFIVTCEWVEVEPRELRGVTAYKSYVYKEIARLPHTQTP